MSFLLFISIISISFNIYMFVVSYFFGNIHIKECRFAMVTSRDLENYFKIINLLNNLCNVIYFVLCWGTWALMVVTIFFREKISIIKVMSMIRDKGILLHFIALNWIIEIDWESLVDWIQRMVRLCKPNFLVVKKIV